MTPRIGWRFWAVLPGGWLRDPYREGRPLLVPQPTATCDRCSSPPGPGCECGMYFCDTLEDTEARAISRLLNASVSDDVAASSGDPMLALVAEEARHRYQYGMVITRVTPLGRVLRSVDPADGTGVWRAAALRFEAVSGAYMTPEDPNQVVADVARMYRIGGA